MRLPLRTHLCTSAVRIAVQGWLRSLSVQEHRARGLDCRLAVAAVPPRHCTPGRTFLGRGVAAALLHRWLALPSRQVQALALLRGPLMGLEAVTLQLHRWLALPSRLVQAGAWLRGPLLGLEAGTLQQRRWVAQPSCLVQAGARLRGRALRS